MKRRIIGIMFVLFMVTMMISGCTSTDAEAEANGQEQELTYTPVEVSEVARTSLANITTINGKVIADKDIMILPTIPGKVKSVAVEDGDLVSAGDLLFTLDEKNIQSQVNQAKAGYDMAKANYDMTVEQVNTGKKSLEQNQALVESLLDNARENLINTELLFEAGAPSQSQLDQARLALEQQETQLQGQLDQAEMASSDQILEVAKSQLDQAQIAYSQAQDALKDASVTSPIDGVVTGISIEAGGLASNAQPAMNIVDMNRVYVNVDVVEGLINQLGKDQGVMVTIPAISDEPFHALIDNVVPVPNARTQLYPIRIYLDNSEGAIKPGMFANVELALDVKEDVIAVPSQAIIFKDGLNVVYIVEDDKAVEKEVELGLDTGSEVEIKKGIKVKDKIIIKGQNYLANGGDVKVVGGSE